MIPQVDAGLLLRVPQFNAPDFAGSYLGGAQLGTNQANSAMQNGLAMANSLREQAARKQQMAMQQKQMDMVATEMAQKMGIQKLQALSQFAPYLADQTTGEQALKMLASAGFDTESLPKPGSPDAKAWAQMATMTSMSALDKLKLEKEALDIEKAKKELATPLSPEGKVQADIAAGIISPDQMAKQKPLSAESAKVLEIAQGGMRSVGELSKLLQEKDINLGKTAVLPNLLLSSDEQNYNRLSTDLADMLGRLRSGGAINKDEEARFRSLLPSFGDTKETVAKKLGEMQNKFNTIASGLTGGTLQTQSLPEKEMAQIPVQYTDTVKKMYPGISENQIRRLYALQGGGADMAKLGDLSAKYESGSAGYSSVSTGKGDPGGVSYGKYQLASKTGTLQDFLKKSGYSEAFSGKPVNSEEFKQTWKELATNDPSFANAQDEYIKRTHFDPLQNVASKFGIQQTPRVQQALFSMSVQHGKAEKIVEKAAKTIKPTDTEETVLQKLYNARKQYVSSLSSLSGKMKSALLNRFTSELKDLLGNKSFLTLD